MGTWGRILLQLIAGAYFFLTSLYCLLAFLPYTYYSVIKEPPYAWVPWFVKEHAHLYWWVLLLMTVVSWRKPRNGWYYCFFGVLMLFGGFITLRPFLPALQNNNASFIWSLVGLFPLALGAAADSLSNPIWWTKDEAADSLLSYRPAILASIAIALLYGISGLFHGHTGGTVSKVFGPVVDSELLGWSIFSHITIAVFAISILNLIRIAVARSAHARLLRLLFAGVMAAAGLWWALLRFLNSALSFGGWQAQMYAASLAVTLTLLGTSILSSFASTSAKMRTSNPRKIGMVAFCAFMAGVALIFPAIVQGGDWNGIFEATFVLALWITVVLCFYALRPMRRNYSLATVLGLLLFAVFGYKALLGADIYWARPLGSTDDSILRTMELYEGKDASFEMTQHLLGNARIVPCGDLCHILRQYANIRGARVVTDSELVKNFVPTHDERPNIFIFVIDSLRPDYLGAYNPKVDFTPRLDNFARDSFVVRNAYTQYAGTSLSEPAIWAGAMLLHAHYQQPFHKLNGLEKLVETDNYQMIVSWDMILQQILAPPPDIIKLDTDKPLWNNFEVCSTVRQTEDVLDRRADKSRPIFFYAQPMNVHQFARNNFPTLAADHWAERPGFKSRIAHSLTHVDACLGSFFDYLKDRGMYENSIIIVTADHGDATGELGRSGHSVLLYPEVMRVPLIVHLPERIRKNIVYDDTRISALTDITPSLYYLLGHRPVVANQIFGRPLFMQTAQEMQSYPREDLFFASDARAVFGLLEDHGRFFYATYDSPAASMLFDLDDDPIGTKNILTNVRKKQYDRQIIEHLHAIGDFYGYKPGVDSLLTSSR